MLNTQRLTFNPVNHQARKEAGGSLFATALAGQAEGADGAVPDIDPGPATGLARPAHGEAPSPRGWPRLPPTYR